MAQLLLRDLDDGVTERLRQRAQEHGRSLEEEARLIIVDAVAVSTPSEYGWASRVAAEFKDIGFTDDEAAALQRSKEDFKAGRTLSLTEADAATDAFLRGLRAKA
jgi:plasmid stability protein